MFETVVVATHRSGSARAATAQGLQLGHAFGATVHLVCAFPEAPDRQQAEQLLDALTSGEAQPATTHALPGDPADAILQVADEVDADLIVVGNKGLKGARRILGSVPNAIAHRAHCAVMIVNSHGGEATSSRR